MKLFGRKAAPPVIMVSQQNMPIIPPRVIDKIIGNTRIPYRSWYEAIYLLSTKPDAKASEVAKVAHVAWETASKMKMRILKYIDFSKIQGQ